VTADERQALAGVVAAAEDLAARVEMLTDRVHYLETLVDVPVGGPESDPLHHAFTLYRDRIRGREQEAPR
jgi:hypothetical protein